MSEKETTVTVNLTSTVPENGSPKPSGNGSRPAGSNTIIPPRKSANVERAKVILRGGQEDPQTMYELAMDLKGENRFTYARRLLLRASKHKDTASNKKLRLKIVQQLALCTYKDEDLPADERLTRALEILQEVADFDTTTDQETLGLIAAIYKRKWEVDDQRQNLERAPVIIVEPVAPAVGMRVRRQHVLVFVGIHVGGEAELPHVVQALNAPGLFLGLGYRGQQHGGENRDDGDDHQQFDEGETRIPFGRFFTSTA